MSTSHTNCRRSASDLGYANRQGDLLKNADWSDLSESQGAAFFAPSFEAHGRMGESAATLLSRLANSSGPTAVERSGFLRWALTLLHVTNMRGVAALLRDTRPFQSGPRLLRPVLEAAAPRARLRAVSLSHNYSPSVPTSPIPSPTAPTPSPLSNASTSATAPRQTPTRGTPYALGSPENLLLPPWGLGLSPGTGRAYTLPLSPAHGASGIATPALFPTSPTGSPAATDAAAPLPANASTSAAASCQTPTRGTPYALASPENLLLPPRGLGLSPGIGRACILPLAPAHGACGIATPAFVSASPTALQATGHVGDASVGPALFAPAPAPAAVSCSPASQNTRALP